MRRIEIVKTCAARSFHAIKRQNYQSDVVYISVDFHTALAAEGAFDARIFVAVSKSVFVS